MRDTDGSSVTTHEVRPGRWVVVDGDDSDAWIGTDVLVGVRSEPEGVDHELVDELQGRLDADGRGRAFPANDRDESARTR